MIEKIKRYLPLILALGFGIAFLVLWIVFIKCDISSLFVNLSAGFFLSAFTIGGIDTIQKKQRDRELMPIQKALLRDVDHFRRDLVDLWQEMYIQSTENHEEITIEKLFSKEVIEGIYENLDLEGKPDGILYSDWYQYIKHYHDRLNTVGNRILGNYASVAPPEIMETIHYLIYNCELTGDFITLAIQRIDYEDKKSIPHRSMLKTYTMVPKDNDYQKVQHLLAWCREYRKKIYGDIIVDYNEKIIIIDIEKLPTSILTEEKKERIESDWVAWQENNL